MSYHPKCLYCGKETDKKDGVDYCYKCKIYFNTEQIQKKRKHI